MCWEGFPLESQPLPALSGGIRFHTFSHLFSHSRPDPYFSHFFCDVGFHFGLHFNTFPSKKPSKKHVKKQVVFLMPQISSQTLPGSHGGSEQTSPRRLVERCFVVSLKSRRAPRCAMFAHPRSALRDVATARRRRGRARI